MKRKTPTTRAALHAILLSAFLAAGIAEIAIAADGGPSEPERIAWRKVPIEIALPVGAERLLHFPEPVKVGLPPQLQMQLRLQSIEGTLYARANTSFEATRVLVQGLESGQMYVLDLSAIVDGASTAITLYRPDGPGLQPVTHSPTDRAEHTPWSSPYGYATLTRFAAQQLYVPARLLQPLPGVVRIPVRHEPVPLVRGGAVTAEPLVAWRSGARYLTAVQLTNTTDSPLILDPRELRGRWLTATFQHNRLHAAGSEADRTVVYLIADRPFADAL